MIERVADARLRIYLYHIPPVAQVPISLALIERLLKAYPRAIAGIKDSSGDWNNTAAMLREFQPQGFDVFAGSEAFLLATLRAGGAGCITATGNVNPGADRRAAPPLARRRRRRAPAGAERHPGVCSRSLPMIAAMKAAIAARANDPSWAVVRPPLVELDAAQRAELEAGLERCNFTMPGAESLAAAD